MPQQPNMQQLLKQAQKMQQDMIEAQEALKDEIVEASAGGGMVTVRVSGDLEVKSITIDREAVDPDDVELLQDMVLAAVNEALRSAQELASSKLGGTAQRLAFYLLRASEEEALALADAIREVKERIGLCEICFNLADGPICRICQDERRDAELICVVEEPGDVI